VSGGVIGGGIVLIVDMILMVVILEGWFILGFGSYVLSGRAFVIGIMISK